MLSCCFALIHAVAHCVLMLPAANTNENCMVLMLGRHRWANSSIPSAQQYWVMSVVGVTGWIMLVLFIVMILASIRRIRSYLGMNYQTFLQIHMLWAVVCLLACIHAPSCAPWLATAMILFMTDKLILRCKSVTVEATFDALPHTNITRITFDATAGGTKQSVFEVGQWVRIALDRDREHHPISIASSIFSPQVMTLFVAAHGDWSRRIRPAPTTIIDPPVSDPVSKTQDARVQSAPQLSQLQMNTLHLEMDELRLDMSSSCDTEQVIKADTEDNSEPAVFNAIRYRRFSTQTVYDLLSQVIDIRGNPILRMQAAASRCTPGRAVELVNVRGPIFAETSRLLYCPNIVITTAGIGVTPFLGALESLADALDRGRVLPDGSMCLVQSLSFHWVNACIGYYNMLSNNLIHRLLEKRDQGEIQISFKFYLTSVGVPSDLGSVFWLDTCHELHEQGELTNPAFNKEICLYFGRPNWREMLQVGLYEFHSSIGNSELEMSVFFCGPERLGKHLDVLLREVSNNRVRYTLYKESFGGA